MNILMFSTLLVCESTHRHRSGPQEVKVRVFPEQVTLRMGGVKLLSAHDEMAGEVAPCTQIDSFLPQITKNTSHHKYIIRDHKKDIHCGRSVANLASLNRIKFPFSSYFFYSLPQSHIFRLFQVNESCFFFF